MTINLSWRKWDKLSRYSQRRLIAAHYERKNQEFERQAFLIIDTLGRAMAGNSSDSSQQVETKPNAPANSPAAWAAFGAM